MSHLTLVPNGGTVIAALHLPPLPGDPDNTESIEAILEFAVANAQVFASHSVDATYLQDTGRGGGSKRTDPSVVAALAVVAHAVRRVVSIPIGVLSAGYDAAGPLAAANAAAVDFVRLKVYVGAMVRAEGMVEGCAAEAVAERRRLGANHIRILADVHDRSGVPLAPESLEDAVRWAERVGSADALIVTGRRFDESILMLDRARRSGVRVPLLCGGGATIENVGQLLTHCDGVIVSAALKAEPPNANRPWDPLRIDAFMAAVRGARQTVRAAGC